MASKAHHTLSTTDLMIPFSGSKAAVRQAGNGAVHAIYPMPYVLKLGRSNELPSCAERCACTILILFASGLIGNLIEVHTQGLRLSHACDRCDRCDRPRGDFLLVEDRLAYLACQNPATSARSEAQSITEPRGYDVVPGALERSLESR